MARVSNKIREEFEKRCIAALRDDGFDLSFGLISHGWVSARALNPEDQGKSYYLYDAAKGLLLWNIYGKFDEPKKLYCQEMDGATVSKELIKKTDELLEKLQLERQVHVGEASRFRYARYKQATEDNPYLKKKGMPPFPWMKQDEDGNLILPLIPVDALQKRDEWESSIENLETIYEDGRKMTMPDGKVLGCIYPPFESSAVGVGDTTIICEGCATGYSCAVATGLEVVCCRSANNMLAVAQQLDAIWEGTLHKFIFAADNDISEGNGRDKKNTGVQAAQKAAEAVGGYVAIPPLVNLRKTDFDDVRRLCEDGLERIKRAFEKSIGSGAYDLIPKAFHYDAGTGTVSRKKKNDAPGTTLCRGLFLEGRARDAGSESWSTVLTVTDHDGCKHRIVASQDEISTQSPRLFSRLNNAGIQMDSADVDTRKSLCNFLMAYRTSRRIWLAPEAGWFDDNAYVFPGETLYREEPKAKVEFISPNLNPGFSKGGTLKGSMEMLRLLAGSPLCEAVICHCLAGPLLPLLDCEGTGLLLTGDSSSGKTTSMRAAASLQGPPNKMVRSCRSTANALEVIFAMHNHGYLCLDEIGEMTARDLDQTTYMASNGQGKNRMRDDTSLRRNRRWLCNFVCTGEKSVAEKLMEGGLSPMAGQDVRLPGLSADGGAGLGIFSVLPEGITSGHELAGKIEEMSNTHYGHVFPAFIGYLLKSLADKSFLTSLMERRLSCLSEILPENSGRQIRRIASNLAVDVVAGELAIRAGLLPEEFNPVGSIGFCLKAIVVERGTPDDMEARNILEEFEKILTENASSKFERLGLEKTESAPIINRIGFYEVDGMYIDYIIPCAKFKDLMKRFSIRKVLQVLKDVGYLQMGSENKNGKVVPTPSQTVRLPGMPPMRAYLFHVENSGRESVFRLENSWEGSVYQLTEQDEVQYA